jgi:hypothetical protein
VRRPDAAGDQRRHLRLSPGGAARIAIATTHAELHAAATLREITFVLRDATMPPFRAALAAYAEEPRFRAGRRPG